MQLSLAPARLFWQATSRPRKKREQPRHRPAAAQAAAVANHCYYTNNGSAGSNSHRNSNSFQDLSPGFSGLSHTSKSSNGDGRPSIGTITEQWEFMRINFVNNSDEVIA